MTERKRISLLMVIMAVSSLIIAGITMSILYHISFEAQKARLIVSAQARARLMEATARFNEIHNTDYPGGAYAATLSQINDAYQQFRSFGKTGELTFAKKEGNNMIWLLSHRHNGLAKLKSIPFDSELAEPMRRALSGESGAMVGPDYAGKIVLAAYEPVAILNLGLVTKVDLDEVREPFIKAGLVAFGFTLLIVLISARLFANITRSIIKKVEDHALELEKEITHRRQAEEENRKLNEQLAQRLVDRTSQLTAVQERYSIFFDLVPEITLVSMFPEGRIIEINESFERNTGFTRDEVIGKTTIDLNVWAELEDREKIQQILKENKLIHNFEARFRRKSGTIFPALCSMTLFEIDGIAYVLSVMNDITDRKQLEEERIGLERRLLQAQKLESLGRVTAGIAHNFNNILMSVMGYLEMVLDDLSLEHLARKNLEKALKSAKRAADLTRQILAYSGSGFFIFKEINISRLIEENISSFKSALSGTVSLSLNPAEDIPLINADPEQIRQVILNILINASESIDKNVGTVTLSTGVKDCDDDYLNQSCLEEKPKAGRFIYIEISDTGCGMDAKAKSLLFDPFFTTKFMGRGLGMSAVIGIIRSHKGAIFVNSEPGRGTTIRVLFPVSETKIRERKIVYKESAKTDSLPKMVLIADDEEHVRNLCEITINRLGFRTLTAEDGQEAVEIFQEHADEIDCVLLDLTMPKMDGISAMDAMREIRPDVKIIISSGHSKEEISRRFKDKELTGILQKPFELKYLRDELEASMK